MVEIMSGLREALLGGLQFNVFFLSSDNIIQSILFGPSQVLVTILLIQVFSLLVTSNSHRINTIDICVQII